jgi:hypothetical protein
MASTTKQRKSEASGLEFPGRHVYVRTTNEDTEAPEHQARVQSWIQDYEKSRQVFIFPTPTVRTFATLILVLGLLSLFIQVKRLFPSKFVLIVNAIFNRLPRRLCAMHSCLVFSAMGSGLACSVWPRVLLVGFLL